MLALLIAMPLGVITAYRATSRFDRASNATAFGLLAIPNFALALVLAYYVGVQLEWLPVSGYVAPSEDLVEHSGAWRCRSSPWPPARSLPTCACCAAT